MVGESRERAIRGEAMTRPRRRQAGEGGISEYETKAGPRFLIKYTVILEDGSTKVVLRRGFPTRKAAAQALGDINAELRQGRHVLPSKKTVGQWGDEWLDSLRLAPSTMASYRKLWRLYIKPHLGSVPLDKLTGTAITTMYRKLETGGRHDGKAGEGLSARSIRYAHTTVKASLREAVAQGLLATNPADKAKPPAAREAKPPGIHPWSAQQLATWRAWVEEQQCPDAVAWRVLAFTGVRRGEVLALRWRDLDGDGGRLSVRRSVGVIKTKGEAEQLIEGGTKSGRERVVDLDSQTVDALRRYRVARAGLSLQLTRDDALIFGDEEGQHLHPDRFSWRFTNQLARCRRQLGEAAPPTIRLHDLRHTHASLLLAAGVPVKVVSERLGHATVTITLEIYAHTMPGMQSEAAAKFAAMVGGVS
jgi:integrase